MHPPTTPQLTPSPLHSKLLPLAILLLFLLGLAFIGYQIYLTTQKISVAASDKMQRKNVVFTKDGVRVGVKEMKNENYVDKTQGFLVKAWTLSSWPAYQSRLGWNKEDANASGGQMAEQRKP
ncbi:cytochrome p450 monooxygenase protein [Rutstroemia sp. NJR-2017a BVV2]|nr:cytochrome p450 monooxygenase protein [Rutstroemia sp. NJR-2017a BVV2]